MRRQQMFTVGIALPQSRTSDNGPPQLIPAEPFVPARLFAMNREISVRVRLRGGGRSLCRTGLGDRIPC